MYHRNSILLYLRTNEIAAAVQDGIKKRLDEVCNAEGLLVAANLEAVMGNAQLAHDYAAAFDSDPRFFSGRPATRPVVIYPHRQDRVTVDVKPGTLGAMVAEVADKSEVYAVHILVGGKHVGPPTGENQRLTPPDNADIVFVHDCSMDHQRHEDDKEHAKEKSWRLGAFKGK